MVALYNLTTYIAFFIMVLFSIVAYIGIYVCLDFGDISFLLYTMTHGNNLDTN